MRLHLIAVHYRSKTAIDGFRIIDSDTGEITDQPYSKVCAVLTAGHNISGLGLEDSGRVKGVAGVLSRYPRYENGMETANSRTLIILYEIVDASGNNIGYRVCTSTGKQATTNTEGIFSSGVSIANGKLVKNADGTRFISSIYGSFHKVVYSNQNKTAPATVKANTTPVNTPAAPVQSKVISTESKAADKPNSAAATSSGSVVKNIVGSTGNKKELSRESEESRRERLLSRHVSNTFIKGTPCDKELLHMVDPKTKLSVEDKIIYALLGLRECRVFYYNVLSSLNRVFSTDRKTMSISPLTLYMNPYYILEESIPAITFSLIHECSHYVMKHHARMKSRDKEAWNYATDYYINESIIAEFNIPRLYGVPVKIFKKGRDGKNEETKYSIAIPNGVLTNNKVDITKDTPEILYDEILKKASEQSDDDEQEQEQGQGQSQDQGNSGSGSNDNEDYSSLEGTSVDENNSEYRPNKNKNQKDNKDSKEDDNSTGSEKDSGDNSGSDNSSKNEYGDESNDTEKSDGSGDNSEESSTDGSSYEGTPDNLVGDCDSENGGTENDGNNSGKRGNSSSDKDGDNSEGDEEAGEGNESGETSNYFDDVKSEGDKSSDGNGGGGNMQGNGEDAGKSKSPSRLVGKEFRGQRLPERENDLVEDSKSMGMSDESRQRSVDATIARAATLTKKQMGSFGGDTGDFLERYVEDTDVPKLNWRNVLRTKLNKASQVVNTFAAPDKRFRSRGMILPGPKKLENDKLYGLKVCIDTSGSKSPEELGEDIAYIIQLLKTYKVDAEVIFWDTRIRHVQPLQDIKDLRNLKAYGGGGTDPNCVYEYFETDREYRLFKKVRPSLVLMFTDGYFGEVLHKYKKYDTIWVINGNDSFHAPFGLTTHTKRD